MKNALEKVSLFALIIFLTPDASPDTGGGTGR